MEVQQLLYPILHDENLTRGLGDPEARLLVEWLVEQVEGRLEEASAPGLLRNEVQELCQQARRISRFVRLWCLDNQPAAACQLAATERLAWPLPSGAVDPCDLMQTILAWEAQQRASHRQGQQNLAG